MNKLISKLPKGLVKATKKSVFALKKYAPDIFIVVGVGLIVGATIEACRRSPEAKDILEEHNEKRETLGERTKENSKEVADLYRSTAIEMGKTYAAPAAVFTAGLVFIFYSHHILKQRNAALLSAYASLDAAFKAYREKAIRENDILRGEKDPVPAETHFENGIEVDERGFPVSAVSGDPLAISPYAFIFGPTNRNWKNNPLYNYNTLLGLQKCAQIKYNTVGHIFWNEILDGVDEKRTPAGAVMGWVEGISPEEIDLGIECPPEVDLADWLPRFERPIVVSPNLYDVIWDKI